MRYVCPYCWQASAPESSRCPSCGQTLERSWKSMGYADKLIRALRHPVMEVRIRAAGILGRLREPRAVPALIRLLQQGENVYVQAASAQALREIGSPKAMACLKKLAAHPSALVRTEAQQTSRQVHGEDPL